MPEDYTLTPASRDDLVQSLSYALRFDGRGKSHRHADDFMSRIAAETLVRHLEVAGYVVMKRPPRPMHSTPKPR